MMQTRVLTLCARLTCAYTLLLTRVLTLCARLTCAYTLLLTRVLTPCAKLTCAHTVQNSRVLTSCAKLTCAHTLQNLHVLNRVANTCAYLHRVQNSHIHVPTQTHTCIKFRLTFNKSLLQCTTPYSRRSSATAFSLALYYTHTHTHTQNTHSNTCTRTRTCIMLMPQCAKCLPKCGSSTMSFSSSAYLHTQKLTRTWKACTQASDRALALGWQIFAGILSNIQSNTAHIYGSGQPYTCRNGQLTPLP